MEPKFQTSFIPKKPLPMSGGGLQSLVKPPKKGISIFMILSVTIFVLSLGSIGGAYAWKQYLTQKREEYKKALSAHIEAFDINQITQLKHVSTQIETAKKLLNNHLAMSQIFDIIGAFTSVDVRFLSMDLSTERDGIKISMTGAGKNLPAVAFQSQVLTKLQDYNLRNVVKNPIITNTAFGSRGATGFNFSATISPAPLNYVKALLPDDTDSNTGSTTPNENE